jgi:hypothetical protein
MYRQRRDVLFEAIEADQQQRRVALAADYSRAP